MNMSYREERVAKIMEEEGLDRMQAINVCRARNAVHDRIRRNPRAFDFRFGGGENIFG